MIASVGGSATARSTARSGGPTAAVRKYGVGLGVRDRLAEASETTHPREALEVYGERVEQLLKTGGNPAYKEAAKLVARMATLRSAGEQRDHVLALKVRHGRKRNFMQLLG